jgi:DNA recombination protein RmuC
MQALIAVLAAVFGIVIGYWLRQHSLKSERAQINQRAAELSSELASARTQLNDAQSLAASRAGFESLCAERQTIIDRLTTERDQAAAAMQEKVKSESVLSSRIGTLEAELRGERQNLAEKLAILESAKQALSSQFEALAGEILDKKSRSFSEASQKDLGTLLSPLQLQLKEFRERVEKVQTENTTGVTELKTLIGSLNSMNQQLADEARNLTTALRGSAKAQGDWGELIVRNLLEKAGLREGEQFRVQESFDAAFPEGDRRRLRPDVIVNLPGSRHLVVDSKVSLNAWSDWVNAATDDERKLAMRRHLASVRAHIDELATRNYHKLAAIDSPDFVVMFVPIEPAFLAALHEDENLWRYAYEKEVLLVGPTTLLFVIRIVDNLWQQELQARNVQEVMDRGTELYEKFVNFVADLESIGKGLHAAEQCYGDAMKKLSTGRGNLVRQVEMLRELGVKSSKSLPKPLLDGAGINEPLALAAEAAERVESD